jgi:hypothetical protein
LLRIYGNQRAACRGHAHCHDRSAVTSDWQCRRTSMGKYFLGWLLGVPVFVLVLLYFFFG